MEQVGANHGNQTATTTPAAAAAVVNGGGKKGNEGQNSLGEGNPARAAATAAQKSCGGTIGQGTGGADPKGSVPTPPVFVITSSSSNYVSGEKSTVGGGSPSNKSSTLSNAVGLPSHSVRDASSSPVVIAQEEDPGEPPAKTSQRPSNPRQSTLTRSHAITLDEDSDGQEHVGNIETETQHEEQLIQFLIETCNKSSKDRNFVLRIEADLVQFVKDSTRQTLPFPQMSSYQRMLVHRMATLFDLDHNVDNSTGGNFVVVSKDLSNKQSRQGQLPSIRFKELLSSPVLVPSHSQEECAVPDSTTGKKILKREKPQNTDKNRPMASKTKSLEERTQDYHKARRRIFEESGGSVDSIENQNPSGSGFSNKKLNWSSTDSSEDRMYLKPPFPSSGKLIKVESFESASQRKPSNRDSRQMGKSHSFGGYEDSGQQPTHPPHAQSYKRTSNNASSSMISCSSSSSIRSSSFSKQDSSSSTTSGSGQSPSGGTSSSGYKSGGSGDRNVRSQVSGTVVYGQQQSYSTLPVVHSPQVQEQESTTVSQSQQVMFCCWAVADVNNVPPGAIIIDPNTGQAVKNTDGSQYYYDPTNPPKFVGNPGTPVPPMEYYSNTVQYGSVQACASVPPPPPPPPPASQTLVSQPPPPPQYIQYTQESSPQQQQQTHELSSYFSNMSVSSNAQRLPPIQVIYVPVDAVNTTYGNTATPPDASNTGQVVYYEVEASNVQVQAPPQNQSQGYVFQNIENTGSQAPVYYYGGNLVNTNQTQQPVNLSPMPRGDVPVGGSQPPPQFQQQPQQQQRVKNWVLPNTNVLMHTAPHSMAYAGGNASQQGGLVQVPNLQPPTHVAPQQQQPQQQQPGPGALVPLGYHGQQQQSAPTTPHTIMHSLVPVQNPVQFPQPPVSSYVPVQSTPHYAPPPNYSTSMSSTPHQSFVPQPMNPQQRTFVPQSTTPQPPRFIMPAAAAVAHQQQILFAAAAAAAAMGFSNTPFSNFTPTSSASAPGSTAGGRGRGIVHGSVTGAHVVRRPAAPKTFVNKNNVQK